MLSATTLVLALSVAAVASAHQNQARAHRAAVTKRSESSVERRDQFSNVPMTWYPTNTGPDACTGNSHSDNDWVRSLPLFTSRLPPPSTPIFISCRQRG
ncbi:hypothetical protein B0H19DRAFT_1202516 [Mycena capillaripes]|nr:hypothetical protein B0H19DRAFT_1202516 [Mycena capillaripes]